MFERTKLSVECNHPIPAHLASLLADPWSHIRYELTLHEGTERSLIAQTLLEKYTFTALDVAFSNIAQSSTVKESTASKILFNQQLRLLYDVYLTLRLHRRMQKTDLVGMVAVRETIESWYRFMRDEAPKYHDIADTLFDRFARQDHEKYRPARLMSSITQRFYETPLWLYVPLSEQLRINAEGFFGEEAKANGYRHLVDLHEMIRECPFDYDGLAPTHPSQMSVTVRKE